MIKQGSYVAGLFLCESCYKDEFRAKYEDKIRKMFESINIKRRYYMVEIFMMEIIIISMRSVSVMEDLFSFIR